MTRTTSETKENPREETRSETVPSYVEVVEQTTMLDNIADVEVADQTLSKDYIEWPLTGIEDVLSRYYNVYAGSWSYASSQGTVLSNLIFPDALFAVPALWDRVKRFWSMRADLEVEYRINSTPFHYGALLVSYRPYLNESAPEAAAPDLYSASGDRCAVVSANTSRTVRFVVPWQAPNEFLPVASSSTYSYAHFITYVLAPLSIAGAGTNPSLNITVFARFVNPKLLGPSELTATSSRPRRGDKESQVKAKQGVVSSFASTVADVASSVSSVPIIGGVASAVAPIAKAAGGLFDLLGWDKSPNLSATQFVSDRPDAGITNSHGISNAQILALDPETRVSTEDKHFGISRPEMKSLKALIMRPMLLNTFTISSAAAVNTVLKQIYVRPYSPRVTGSAGAYNLYQDFLSYYSNFFQSCRGGYKYLFYFATSTYTSTRVRITFEPTLGSVSSVSYGGETFSAVIDIQGDTWYALTVPYCRPSLAMDISTNSVLANASSNGQLLVSLVNPVQTSGSTDNIFVSVFRAAAEDFEFSSPCSFKPLVAANCDFQSEFTKQFAPIAKVPQLKVEQLINDETVNAHTDYLARLHTAGLYSAGGVIALMPTAGDAYSYLRCFRFYRGAVRIGATIATAAYSYLSYPANNTSAWNNGVNMHGVDPLLSAIPYNNNVRFMRNTGNALTYATADALVRTYTKSDATATTLSLWGSGDDFTLGGVIAPPVLTSTT